MMVTDAEFSDLDDHHATRLIIKWALEIVLHEKTKVGKRINFDNDEDALPWDVL
jgi:hypothetical protein